MSRKREVWKAGRACVAHALLLAFTILLILKLHHLFFRSWWLVFTPLWLFHAVVARGRFSIPSPSDKDAYPWAPFHAVVAIPLLIAFELLLCVYLESSSANQVADVSLTIVFLPIFLLETLIIIDNIRILLPPTPALIEQLSLRKNTPHRPECNDNDTFCQKYIHTLTIVAMAIILGVTMYTLQMITGDPAGHRSKADCLLTSYVILGYGQAIAWSMWWVDMLRVLVYDSKEMREGRNLYRERIGGHVMIIVMFGFQILLYMYFKGTRVGGREISLPIVFSPLFLLQGVGVVFSALQLVDKTLLLLLHNCNATYFRLTSTACEFLPFMQGFPRFIGWWSIDEGAEALELQELGCNAYSVNPPDVLKKMPKNDLVEEVRTLQVAINKQILDTESSQRECERFNNEKFLCKICFDEEICAVLLPCKHRILCRSCCYKCSKCPLCRATIRKRLVHD